MEKNIQKYMTYKNAYDQINSAIANGYFLEAITIEESILTDRLFRFCKDSGFTHSWDRATLGLELMHIKKLIGKNIDLQDFTLIDELDAFWKNRNICLHQIVKSDLREPTMDFSNLIQLANKTALEGKTLCQKANNWAKKYKRLDEKLKK